MELNGKIHSLPKQVKLLLFCFLITLSFGFFTGLRFVKENTNNSVNGITTHYLGNETDENADVLKFKKTEKEIITTIHNHVLSMSIIFFILGLILTITSVHPLIKKILLIEPFVSIIFTFGGIWLLWIGIDWFKYVIIFSGITLTLTFTTTIFLIISQLIKKNK